MKKEETESKKAMEALMTVIEKEVANYDKLEAKDRPKAAATIAVLADKIQKLENTSNEKSNASKEFWLKVGAISIESGLTITGLYFTQKNIKYLHTFEETEVIRTATSKEVASKLLKVKDYCKGVFRGLKL